MGRLVNFMRERTIMKFYRLRCQFFLRDNFVERVFIIIKAIVAFKCGWIRAGSNRRKVLLLALKITHSTFKRTVGFHDDLLSTFVFG